ncbi:MAG: hypothetical protein IJC80_06750, partial [Clostridia bacterium]|nr:hypothetical protein [Clostridia bacterium]
SGVDRLRAEIVVCDRRRTWRTSRVQQTAIINHTMEKNGVFQPCFSIDYRLTIVLNYLWFMLVP